MWPQRKTPFPQEMHPNHVQSQEYIDRPVLSHLLQVLLTNMASARKEAFSSSCWSWELVKGLWILETISVFNRVVSTLSDSGFLWRVWQFQSQFKKVKETFPTVWRHGMEYCHTGLVHHTFRSVSFCGTNQDHHLGIKEDMQLCKTLWAILIHWGWCTFLQV